jgi:hypothetical protein
VVRPEEHVDPRSEVREIVPRPIDARVMPVVQLGRAEHPSQRPERQVHVRVDEDGPHASQCGEGCERAERHAQQEGGEVLAKLRRDAVERVLAVGREEVEVFGAVVDGVEAPQRLPRVARAMEPVDEHVAEDDRDRA